MMKVEGLKGSKYHRGGIWWVKYYQFGRPIRESTKSGDEREADKLLLKRCAAIEEGRTVRPQVNRCKVDALFDMVVTDYRVNNRKTLDDTERRITLHLKPYFGGRSAIGITSDLIVRYIEHRQRQTYRGKTTSNAEINLELAILRRGYTLAREAEKIDSAPIIKQLEENNTRKGFFERAEFEAIVAYLPPAVAPVVRFAYVTGWRNNEVLHLEWRHVDWSNRVVRLDPGTTKNGEGRVFTFTSELEEVLRSQDTYTRAIQHDRQMVCPWVFHRKGKRIKDYYRAWWKACLLAGFAVRDPKTNYIKTSRIPHDFRRTAVRNLVNAGVAERVAMEMTGHKTRAIFDRYHIVNPRDLERASALLDAKLSAERAEHAAGHNPGTVAPIRDAVDIRAARK
jgi:integrase